MIRASGFRALLRELASFSLVGAAATGIYVVVANAAIYLFGIEAKLASVIGFITGSVFSFLGQSRLTFRINRPDRRNLIRFGVQTMVSLLISYYAVFVAVDVWRLPAIFGTIAVCILIPAVNYLGMKFIVFRQP